MQKTAPTQSVRRLGGYVHLPRLIDKAKLHRKGLLDGYSTKPSASISISGFLKLNRTRLKSSAPSG
jgi:hypothetical protein